MEQESAAMDALIKGGLIDAALGASLLKDKEEGSVIGALLGAAIAATIKANADAQRTDQPVLIAENGKLYKILNGQPKEFVKDLPHSMPKRVHRFKLN
jgi:hypothetical protein